MLRDDIDLVSRSIVEKDFRAEFHSRRPQAQVSNQDPASTLVLDKFPDGDRFSSESEKDLPDYMEGNFEFSTNPIRTVFNVLWSNFPI